MSAQIKQEHKEYYDILESTQKGIMDVTAWMLWFLDCLGRAIDGAHVTLKAVLDKARFWDRIKDVPLNDRQRSVINRLLDGFEGRLTSSKYAKLTKCSQDTAYRDILALVERHVLDQNPEGGRSTSYSLASFESSQGSNTQPNQAASKAGSRRSRTAEPGDAAARRRHPTHEE
jgi:Fic family protein